MFRGLLQLYSVNFADLLVRRMEFFGYRPVRFLAWFWQSKSFDTPEVEHAVSPVGQLFSSLLSLVALAQIIAGVWLLVAWARFGTVGFWEFGAALLLSYPLVGVHALTVVVGLYRGLDYTLHPKRTGRSIVCAILEHQVRVLRRKNQFKVIAVAGSVGKTSTKLAIADLLSQGLMVRHQTGNYNDRVTVPLVFFGQAEPRVFNMVAWLKLFGANQAMLSHHYEYDVVVVELGTDAPGQLADFAYLEPDLAVVTAVTPEHMAAFKTLDAVAAEELTVFNYSAQVLINADDIAGKYLAGRQFLAYSLTSQQAEYFATRKAKGLDGQELKVIMPNGKYTANIRYVGAQGAKFGLAAVAAADMLGMDASKISHALPRLAPFAGRMQVLRGVAGSMLIDDTYNASPVAVCAALDALYGAPATRRIAILGSMNEMGDYSQQAHETVGAYCDPKKLDLLVTIGKDAANWLAPAAAARGCTVQTFTAPHEAGEYVAKQLKTGAVVLAKGSQNGVFAEEALKPLLADPADSAKLVRQSAYWLKQKKAQFNG